MRTGSLSEYAAHRKVGPSYVTKLKQEGRLVMVQVGNKRLVNFEMSDRMITNTADQSRAGAGRNSPSARADRHGGMVPAPDSPDAPPSPPAPPPMNGGGPVVDAVFRRAQTQEKVLAAKTAEVVYKKLIGEVLEKTVVERAVFDAFRSLRDHAFQAPQRAALRAAGLADLREVERVFAEELRKAFEGWESRMSERLPVRAQ